MCNLFSHATQIQPATVLASSKQLDLDVRHTPDISQEVAITHEAQGQTEPTYRLPRAYMRSDKSLGQNAMTRSVYEVGSSSSSETGQINATKVQAERASNQTPHGDDHQSDRFLVREEAIQCKPELVVSSKAVGKEEKEKENEKEEGEDEEEAQEVSHEVAEDGGSWIDSHSSKRSDHRTTGTIKHATTMQVEHNSR
ncbi:unnamed protein product [Protopolystoma xenopodis]|uniref:Uncharacterized protein n=1 Tax=Protopolystoma xenopodis TaxID=117903 RepID=A0A3S5FDN7_9PLAT|nr:unnamed protein product [Protopolystoma xenopodis]